MGGGKIIAKAFLDVGDAHHLFDKQGLKLLDITQRDISGLNVQV